MFQVASISAGFAAIVMAGVATQLALDGSVAPYADRFYVVTVFMAALAFSMAE